MPDMKSIHSLREIPSPITLLESQNGETNLRSQLRREIDRLALLIDEVKRQGDKVLAVADAIGDRVLVGNPAGGASKNRRSDLESLLTPENRK